MAQLFTNNATSTLASGINNSATSISLAAGTGSRFPNPSGGDYFYLTILQRTGNVESNHEVVKVTARSTDTLTVTRAQEGTTAKSFNSADPVELRLTTGFLKDVTLTDVLFSGNARRIKGDFDNATLGNRTLFEAAGTNATTSVGAIPSGNNTQSDFTVFNSSDPANSSYFGHTVTSTKALLTSGNVGTGTVLPVVVSVGGNDRLTVTPDGRVYGSALHNNAGSVTGTTNQYVASGTYTPTKAGLINVTTANITTYPSQWIRVGNVVTVSGGFILTPDASGGVGFNIGMPIAGSTGFSDQSQCAGVVVDNGGITGRIYGVGLTDKMAVNWIAPGASTYYFSFTFTYVIT